MITIIAGTNRPNSNSRIIANIYAGILSEKHNQPCQILDLQDLPDDFTATALYDNIGKSEAFNKLVTQLAVSDKYVFVLPEYNGSFPGVLKAFLDGLPYPNALKGKKSAMVAISNGTQGGLLAMSHLTDIFHYLGLHVLATKVRIPQIHNHLFDAKLVEPFYMDLLEQQAAQFLAF